MKKLFVLPTLTPQLSLSTQTMGPVSPQVGAV